MKQTLEFFTRVTDRIAHKLSVHEVVQSTPLKATAVILIFGSYLQFATWWRFADFTTNAVTAGKHLCWPFFQSCGDWYFLSIFPSTDTHGAMYMLLFVLLLFTGKAAYEGKWNTVMSLMLVCFVWEMTVMIFSMRLTVNYWYFHAFYMALFLFSRNKLAWLQVGAASLYFFAGVLKIDPSWIYGSYFTGLQEGLYGFPNALIPFATNAVTILELVGPILLLTQKQTIRTMTVAVLCVFHAYSTIYVGYLYPFIAFPLVYVLFSQPDRPTMRALKERGAGMYIIAILIIIHILPSLIPGNARITQEGNRYGMYMFEANYHCRADMQITHANNTTEDKTLSTDLANKRCDPYAFYFYAKNACAREPGARIKLTVDSAINGDPFYRIVDTPNACALTYSWYKHNNWIKRPEYGEAAKLETPPKNRYNDPEVLWVPIGQ